MSDDSDDDFAVFGTPLEPLDEGSCQRRKPLTIEEQFAKDKHGRRRFHGAFTGGFSAGFLNTVGSLEGFHPLSFKSSKSNKAQSIVQKPQHFMDEEDIGEFGIAPSVLRAKDDYQSSSVTKMEHFDDSDKVGTSALQKLLKPVRETVGIKLLRVMGWKPGQGVGPRVTKREKKRISQVRKKVYGCALPDEKGEEDESDSDTDDEALQNITFAPNDFPFQMVTPKENFFGLGYVGLDRRSVLSAPKAKPNFLPGNKKSITGAAFGVGALEEEDEDIYLQEDMSQYDFALGSDQDKKAASEAVVGDLYEIFVLGVKVKDTIFKPPILPGKPKRGGKCTTYEPVPDSSKTKQHDPERKIPPRNRDELHKQARLVTEVLSLPTQVTFQPFIFDSDKEERYEKYINLLAKGKPDDLANIQPLNMTEWDREKERIEFEQANKLFKPLSCSLQDRFAAAMQYDHFSDSITPIDKMKFGTDDEVKAAKMNLYGRLTRTIEDWIPCSLLCKRFNIREKTRDEQSIPKSKTEHSVIDDFMISLHPTKSQTQQGDKTVLSQPHETDDFKNTIESKNLDFDNLPENKTDLFSAIFLDTDSDDNDNDSDIEAHNKTDNSQSMEKGKTKTDDDIDTKMLYDDTMVSKGRNTSPARGIFENLDYDILISHKPKNTNPEVENDDEMPGPSGFGVTPCSEVEQEKMDIDIPYGPKLPETFPQEKTNFVPYTLDCKNWVEKSANTTPKKNKKRKKSKRKSKYKSKHKKHY